MPGDPIIPDGDSATSQGAAESVGQVPQSITSPAIDATWVKSEIAVAKKEVMEEADQAIQKQVQIDKASLITVFGVFASIISFLTIEFQFLKTVCSLQKILGFTFILFALLYGFNIALDYLVKSRLDNKTPKPNMYFSILVFLFLGIGIFFSFKGNEEFCNDNKTYQRYSDKFEHDFDVLGKQVDERLEKQDTKIDTMVNDINALKIKKP